MKRVLWESTFFKIAIVLAGFNESPASELIVIQKEVHVLFYKKKGYKKMRPKSSKS